MLQHLTLSWRRPLSYRNQSTDLLCKSCFYIITASVMEELSKSFPLRISKHIVYQKSVWPDSVQERLIRKYVKEEGFQLSFWYKTASVIRQKGESQTKVTTKHAVSGKLRFLTPWYGLVRVSIRRQEMYIFWKI